MELRVIGTGSQGNAYLLQADRSSLLLDAGLPPRVILAALARPEQVAGCLITHEHMDHIRAAPTLMARGIPCYASQGTWNAFFTEHGAAVPFNACHTVSAKKRDHIGDFAVMAFDLRHDAAQPVGYLIRHEPTGETLLYATDTRYLPYTFPGVHHWLVECNYCDDRLNALIDPNAHGQAALVFRRRLRESHLSLERLKSALAHNDLSTTRRIILCHLSDQRSDEARMVREIADLTGVETLAAHCGDVIPLSVTPF